MKAQAKQLRHTMRRVLPRGVRRRVVALIPAQWWSWYRDWISEAALVSFPKSGRTWVRVMLGKAIALHYRVPASEDLLLLRKLSRVHPKLPEIQVTHDGLPHHRTPEEVGRAGQDFAGKRVIFLVRDPRDVVVSLYFHRTKRDESVGGGFYRGTISQFIREDLGSLRTIIRYYNAWERARDRTGAFLQVRYEDLQSAPGAQLRRILEFIGIADPSDAVIAAAVEFAAFDNMRALEKEKVLSPLTPANEDDLESFKTRRGVVGGFRDYLKQEDIEWMDELIRSELSAGYPEYRMGLQ